MQIAGKLCGSCAKKIHWITDGAACPDCSAAYHKTCLGHEQRCPGCGTPCRSEEMPQAPAEGHREQKKARERRAHLYTGVGLLLLGGIITAVSFVAAERQGGTYVITTGLFIVGLWYIARSR